MGADRTLFRQALYVGCPPKSAGHPRGDKRKLSTTRAVSGQADRAPARHASPAALWRRLGRGETAHPRKRDEPVELHAARQLGTHCLFPVEMATVHDESAIADGVDQSLLLAGAVDMGGDALEHHAVEIGQA